MSFRIGETIADLREWKRESQQQLADSIGVKRETVKFWESGERQIKGKDIINLAKHFGVSADYLLNLSPSMFVDDKSRAACEVTRLSETTITSLQECTDESIQIINRLMESELFWASIAFAESVVDTAKKMESCTGATEDLIKEIRMSRFEGLDSLEQAFDSAIQYDGILKHSQDR